MAPATADYRYDDYSAPRPLDRAATEKLVADFVAAIPDFVIVDKPVQFAAGDDVVTEMVEHGTFRGRAITLHGLDVKRFRDGKIVQEWQYANYAEVLQQLFGIVVE
jgi:predicted SnoaL-like aldol condensation-catalyzing enzyme